MPPAQGASARRALLSCGATRPRTWRSSLGHTRLQQRVLVGTSLSQRSCTLSASSCLRTGRFGPIRPIRLVNERLQASSDASPEQQPSEPRSSKPSDESSIAASQAAATLGTFVEHLRNTVWPEVAFAVKKAGPLAALMLLLTFGNTMFDQAKDVMILNVVGPRCIPFFQVYAVLPLALMFLQSYQLLQQVVSRSFLFPVIITTFVSAKLLAAFVLLPKAVVAISVQAGVPVGGLVGLFKLYMSPMLFYGLCELYGDVVLGVLYWGFAIQATPNHLVKKLMPLYCVGANLAQILTGRVLQKVAGIVAGATDQIQVLCGLGAVSCILAIVLHEVLSRTPDAVAATAEAAKAPKSPVKNPNIFTAFRYCRDNVDIRPLAIMAVSSGVASNVLEFAWKLHLSKWLTTPEQVTSFMATVATCAGTITLFLIPLASIAFERIGWSKTAKATPNLLLIAGVPFFLICVGYQALKHYNVLVPFHHPLLVSLSVLGAGLYVGFRSTKFALYKPAEEMVYKKLDERAQTEGKASVDVVAAQFGKTGSSLTQQGLLLLPMMSMFGAMSVLCVAFLTVCTSWRACITGLGVKMDEIEHIPVTAAELADDAVEWGEKMGDWGGMTDAGVRGSKQMWGSDEGPRQSGRCGALDPMLA